MRAEVFFRFITMHAFDRRTDGQTDFGRNIVRMHSQSHGKETTDL